MSLTSKTFNGFIWTFLENFGTQVIQILVFVLLARLLEPKVFGLVAMVTVFVAISQAFVNSGFGSALIQKKDTDELDYSSVFYFNLVLSLLLYSLLYLTAPHISAFYNQPELTDILRVLGLKLCILSLSLVQVTKLTKELKFKKLFLSKLPSTLISGSTGLLLAYNGFGVWSLVYQQLIDATLYTVQLWIQSKWRPLFRVSFLRLRELFAFGSNLLIEGVLSTIYQNLNELMIGKYFSATQVGLYNQANKLKDLPINNISKSLNKVTFPVLSGIQDDDIRLKRAYKKILRQVFFVTTPVMVLAIVLAKPLFLLVLTDKWVAAVPYFQFLCISGLLYPVQSYNLNILNVKGRSDLFLKLGLIKKAVGVVGIVVFVQISVLALVIYKVFHSVFAYFINSYFSGKMIDYTVFEQIYDVKSFIFISILAGIVTYFAMGIIESNLLKIVFGTMLFSSIYLIMVKVLDNEIFISTRQIISRKASSLN